jgi:hypothetical protein
MKTVKDGQAPRMTAEESRQDQQGHQASTTNDTRQSNTIEHMPMLPRRSRSIETNRQEATAVKRLCKQATQPNPTNHQTQYSKGVPEDYAYFLIVRNPVTNFSFSFGFFDFFFDGVTDPGAS